jgi:hypothetical protein
LERRTLKVEKIIGMETAGVMQLPRDVTRQTVAGDAPMILLIIDGVRLRVGQPVSVHVTGSPAGLGYLAGCVKALVDKRGEEPSAQFVTGYDQGYA